MLRRFRGLYGGRHIQFGNQISHAENKTRRCWKPNVLRKRLYSAVLDRWFRFRMTAVALKTMQKHGGLDQYLLRSRDDELLYDRAIRLRERIRQVLLAHREARENAATYAPASDTSPSSPSVK